MQPRENQLKPAAFIDRDGTLIEEVNFLSHIDDLKLFDYTLDALNLLKERGFLIIVVTNQSGIGRRIYDEEAMHSIHRELQHQLSGSIDAFYFCPHLPDEGCICRKPNLGMIESACVDFRIDLDSSWMIGDKKIDIGTGFNAGIKTALVKTGYGKEHSQTLERKPDIIAENLLDAVRLLLL
ncbi:MAG: HAD family hydrolase [Pyrinomonadaceae bacterium]